MALAMSTVYFQAVAFLPPSSPVSTCSFSSRLILPRPQKQDLHQQRRRRQQLAPVTRLHHSAGVNVDVTELEKEIQSMRVSAIKRELESYGISTKSFLEKSELVAALVDARKDGTTPIVADSAPTSSSASPSTSSASSTSASAATKEATSARSSEAQVAEQLIQTSQLKIPELKTELENT